MALSWNIRNVLDSAFSKNIYAEGGIDYSTLDRQGTRNERVNFLNNNFFSRWLDITLDGDTVVFPTFLKGQIFHMLESSVTMGWNIPDKLLYYLPIIPYAISVRKSAYSVLKEAGNYNTGAKLKAYPTEKNGTFYGNSSIMLDDNLDILYYTTFETKCKMIDLRGSSRSTLISDYCKPVYNVNPIVFTKKDNFVSKYIINTALPYYLADSEIEVKFNDMKSILHKPESIQDIENVDIILNDYLDLTSNNVIFDI